MTVAVPLVQAVQDWDEFTGRFEATQSVEVRARVGGYISGVHFRGSVLIFTMRPFRTWAFTTQRPPQL